MKNNKPKISKEMHLVSHANGIKLLTPEEFNCQLSSHSTAATIESVLRLPFSFYFLNSDSATQLINEEGAAVCGFDSAADSLGKTLLAVGDEESARGLISNCSAVIKQHAAKIFEEHHVRKDGIALEFLSLKMPWYNREDKIIGVIGCSIALGRHSLSASLSTLTSMGFLDQQKFSQQAVLPQPELKMNHVHLTRRELQCLKLTIKGYTSKMIAKELGISFRTVEEYLLNVRIKSGASSRSELIGMSLRDLI